MMPCPSYPKIETLFERDEHFHVDTQRIRCPEFTQIARWLVTEKIDGTNIRVSLERNSPDWSVRFYGRTDNAQIPTFLLSYLQDTFGRDDLKGLWRGRQNCELCGGSGLIGHPPSGCSCIDGGYSITLYGEGYGERIQKGGGGYREGVSFRLIDVLVGGMWWLDWLNVCDIAEKLGIKTVPLLPDITGMWDIVDEVRLPFASTVSFEERPKPEGGLKTVRYAEGIVARTNPYLFDKHGRPLRWKLKTKDFGGNNG